MWKICLNNKNTLIPAKRLKEETNGNVITIKLSTIKYFCHEFSVNSPENILDGLSDHTNTHNLMHSENICLSNENMIDFEVIKMVPLKKCINEIITTSEKENLPVVSDDTYNDVIKCDQFDEQIENNEISIEKMKPLVPEYISPDTSNIYETSTARMLVQAIGPNTIIKEFDEIRIKVKRNVNSSIYINEYKSIVARLEVIILPLYYELKQKLKYMERETLQNSASLNVSPKECKEYNNIIQQLKLFQLIKTQLCI